MLTRDFHYFRLFCNAQNNQNDIFDRMLSTNWPKVGKTELFASKSNEYMAQAKFSCVLLGDFSKTIIFIVILFCSTQMCPSHLPKLRSNMCYKKYGKYFTKLKKREIEPRIGYEPQDHILLLKYLLCRSRFPLT